MPKLNTRIRYLCQDCNGAVHASINTKPIIGKDEWFECEIYYIYNGKENQDWRDTLIDLDKDDYDFEYGILRRIEK